MNPPKRPPELDPEFILAAYCSGYFPMAESRTGPISWYSPDPRAVIPLETFHVTRSLRRRLRMKEFTIRYDSSFSAVIRACADREDTWISGEIIRAYTELHRAGFAHSVEAWEGGELAGGLYGLAIRGAFFGESMFSRRTDASKVALVALAGRLREAGFLLLDTQFMNDHVRQFGAVEIPRTEYLELLSSALDAEVSFGGRARLV